MSEVEAQIPQGAVTMKRSQEATRLQHNSPGFWLAFSAIAITNLAVAFDATMLSVAIPTISRSIAGTSTEAFWAGTSYLLSTTIFMLTWVAISDRFGRRPIMLVVLTLFGIGAIIAAVAKNYTTLLAGRTVQGLGGGGVLTLTTILITDLVPLRDRPRFYAIISVIWAIGATSGPIIGGAMAQKGIWRWIFWINVPIVGVGFVGVAFFLKLSRRAQTSRQKFQGYDYVGSALFIAAITSFLIPITWGGVQFPWNSWHTLVPLILGAVGLVSFALYEVYVATNPMIPLSIFLNRSTSILFMGSCAHGLILYTMAFYLPEYFQAVLSYSPIIAGVAALPQTATVVPCAALIAIVVGITGKYRWAVWLGWVLITLGCGLLIKLNTDTSIAAWIFLEAVSGFGLGLLYPSIQLALQSSVPQVDVAMAATLVLFFRSCGQALGVAIGGTILENRLKINLTKGIAVSSPLYGKATTVALVEYLKALPKNDPSGRVLREAFSDSFRVIWAVLCGLGGLTLLAHLAMREYDMNQEHITEQGFIEDKKVPSSTNNVGLASAKA